jgi:hypothetical protein
VNADHVTRLARNEAFFREVNEQINGVAADFDAREQTYEYLCECSDSTCMERILLTFAEYERVRANGERFVLAHGHARNDIEHVVRREGDHVLVEKDGLAGEVAAALDPRAA